MPPEGFLRLHADGQGLAALPGDLEDLLDAVAGVAKGSSLPLAILLVPASTNVAPDLRPGAGGAGTVRRGHGKPWRPVAPCLGRPAGRRGERRAGRPRAGAGPVGHRPDDRGARRGHPPFG